MKITESAFDLASLLDLGYNEEAQRRIQLAMNAHAAEACRPLVEALEDVLNHRREDNDGNHVMWVGETCFTLCANALAAHRLAHGPPEEEEP